jgi:hypothetical protein
MRAVTRVLIAGALAFSAGCASADWIDRTLVTVDVTGTWFGIAPVGGYGEMSIELEQQGATVKGSLRLKTSLQGGDQSGPIEGTVAGDMFRFRNARGSVEGEVTVNGDEMNGRASLSGLGGSSRPISLRRVDSSSRPDSLRR